jgi:predicted Zn-dependent protease
MYGNYEGSGGRRGCSLGGGKLLIALVVAAISVISYLSQSQVNPVTGEKQRVSLSAEQEIALGLQAAPQMAAEFGGEDRDPRSEQLVEQVGQAIVSKSDAKGSPYVSHFDFHALGDAQTVNAFALPGGQIFITRALLSKMSTEGQLAGVLGHEIGHVILRHSAERIAKQQLTEGLTGAAVLATYDPSNPASRNSGAVAQVIGGLVNMKYGREDEHESDTYGVKFMAQAGYDPRSMIDVMKILAEAGGGRGGSEFFQTHPNPENRIAKIEAAIKDLFPNGVPAGLKK